MAELDAAVPGVSGTAAAGSVAGVAATVGVAATTVTGRVRPVRVELRRGVELRRRVELRRSVIVLAALALGLTGCAATGSGGDGAATSADANLDPAGSTSTGNGAAETAPADAATADSSTADASTASSSGADATGSGAAACTDKDVKLTFDRAPGGGAAGSTYYYVIATAQTPCELNGTPTVEYLVGDTSIAKAAPSDAAGPAKPQSLRTGDKAVALLQVGSVDALDPAACKPAQADGLGVTLPGGQTAQHVATTFDLRVCSNTDTAPNQSTVQAFTPPAA